ncbi:LOW QUALITY PROTEIN: Pol protein [Phytophthora palmivora]|uniref:Pol protein n=1 Tax=Phytophthora palmivora TaxID=4796 RepID=A0A2P4Y069_9STRA|nr:LOW QUALITY PROTEIN: Pol protein [Phytophthora palmivora]
MRSSNFTEDRSTPSVSRQFWRRVQEDSAILRFRRTTSPHFSLLYGDVDSKTPPMGLPPDRGVRHEIDLVPGTKYGIRRQWPVPKEQCDVIDTFSHEAGLVRESKSPHSTPTFCVRKPNGKWCIVHAFNKLNAATIPAQTPIPRKDVLQNNTVGCTLYIALDLVDGYYQLLMRASDIPLTAHSERYALGVVGDAQGLSNAPATQLFRPHRTYGQTYFDDIFVHSRAEHERSDVENHVDHLRAVLEFMRTNKLYANADECMFGAEEISFLRCFIGKRGPRADPAKVKTVVDWPVPVNLKDIRKRTLSGVGTPNSNGLLTPLRTIFSKRRYSPSRTRIVQLVSSLTYLICHWLCLLQADANGRERLIAFESRQLKAAEKHYSVHDKELLAMKYALVKFRVHMLGSKPFVVFTDHASLRTATQSAHLSQRMARWLSFFAEYDFEVKYKPGRQNALADALSRRPNYEFAHVTSVSSSVTELIRAAYAQDDVCVAVLRAVGSEESKDLNVTLTGTDRVVVPHDEELKYRFLYEAQDVPLSGHVGRKETYGSVSRDY